MAAADHDCWSWLLLWLLLLLDWSVLEEIDCDCMWNGRGDEVADGEMDEGTEEEAMELESERDDETWSNS